MKEDINSDSVPFPSSDVRRDSDSSVGGVDATDFTHRRISDLITLSLQG